MSPMNTGRSSVTILGMTGPGALISTWSSAHDWVTPLQEIYPQHRLDGSRAPVIVMILRVGGQA